jgi:hypothetical protein
LPFSKAIQERFFDYHEDISPERAASVLGGHIVRYENRNNEWVAIIALERVENAQNRPEPAGDQDLAHNRARLAH